MLSSIEAEYIAFSEAVCEACWLQNLYNELRFTQLSPSIINRDNDSSIVMTYNLQFH